MDGGCIMLRLSIKTLPILAIVLFACSFAAAQGTNPSIFPRGEEKEDPAFGVKDMLMKLQIEKDKKDFVEMQERGKQVLDISNELEKSAEKSNQLSEKDKAKLANLEKLVKKIRKDLGAGDDEDKDDADATEQPKKPSSIVEGMKALRSTTLKLVDELQKTSRFTVSAAAIQTSNAVLRMTRFLKFWN